MNIEQRMTPDKIDDPGKFLAFADVLADSPHTPPVTCIFGSLSANNHETFDYWLPGYVHMDELIYAVLTNDPDPDNHRLLGPFDYRAIHDYFLVEDNAHHPSEEMEYEEKLYENILHDIFWDEHHGLSLVVPSQRLTNYLGVMQIDPDTSETTRWRKPSSDNDILVRAGDKDANGNRSLTICYEHLRDYLAARNKYLLVYLTCPHILYHSLC